MPLTSMETPYLLVALPQMGDEYFMRTVVLVTSHNQEGAQGVIVNKPLVDEEESPALMKAEIKDLEGNTLFEFNEDLFDGGPVNEESLYLLHADSEMGEEASLVGQDLYFSSDPNLFQKILEREESKDKRRFFLGCSIWEPGQLESEMRTGAWMPLPLLKDVLFVASDLDKPTWRDEVWKRALVANGLDPFTLMGQGASDAGTN
jgi:putative transcriptional regulator